MSKFCSRIARARNVLRAGTCILLASLSTEAISQPTSQSAAVVSGITCDNFKKRLIKAGTVLDFAMPIPAFERAPNTDYDHWWVSFSSTKGDTVSDVEASLSCRSGRFQDFEIFDYDIDRPLINVFSHPRAYHLLAGVLYAYTDWQPREVLKRLSVLLDQARDEGAPGVIQLPNEALAKLWINTKSTGTAHLIIESAAHD